MYNICMSMYAYNTTRNFDVKVVKIRGYAIQRCVQWVHKRSLAGDRCFLYER